jgi:hypothetical protein
LLLQVGLVVAVALVAVVVQAVIALAQGFLLVEHIPLLSVLVALPVVRVQLIPPELEQEPMAAPDQLLFLPLLLQ